MKQRSSQLAVKLLHSQFANAFCAHRGEWVWFDNQGDNNSLIITIISWPLKTKRHYPYFYQEKTKKLLMDQHYQLVNTANGKADPANSFDVKIIPSNIRKSGYFNFRFLFWGEVFFL